MRNELILADAGYCSVSAIEYVEQKGADRLVRVDPQTFGAYSIQVVHRSVAWFVRDGAYLNEDTKDAAKDTGMKVDNTEHGR